MRVVVRDVHVMSAVVVHCVSITKLSFEHCVEHSEHADASSFRLNVLPISQGVHTTSAEAVPASEMWLPTTHVLKGVQACGNPPKENVLSGHLEQTCCFSFVQIEEMKEPDTQAPPQLPASSSVRSLMACCAAASVDLVAASSVAKSYKTSGTSSNAGETPVRGIFYIKNR